MSDRLRDLLDRVARSSRARARGRLLAVVAALALFALLTSHGHQASDRRPPRRPPQVTAVRTPPAVEPTTTSTSTAPSLPSQDPQDQPGSESGRRARAAVARRPAFQHIPYDDGHVSITLVGATADRRALLLVSAPTLGEARDGWRLFLARYSDTGDGYVARFEVRSAP